MRQGFTLIELMIVIAIIAIIAAIAIPNLLESRITANEAQAASSLKAGIFPGQTQYQAGGYTDIDGDGRGTFANHVASMAGGYESSTTSSLQTAPPKPLTLLDPKFANQAGPTGKHQGVYVSAGLSSAAVSSSSGARVGAYDYFIHSDVENSTSITAGEDSCESYFGATTTPAKADGSEARRAFGMNGAGTIIQTKQTVTNAAAADVLIVGALANATVPTTSMFATSPAFGLPSANTTNGAPYQK